MLTVLSCIQDRHDLSLVLVAALMCAAGSWATIRLFRRGRISSGFEAIGWQFLTATAAGASVWCTHFIAMLAYEPGVTATFNPVLTIVSLLIAMAGCFAGFMIAGAIHKGWATVAGGVVVGLTVAGMHYAGMQAYGLEGIVNYDRSFVAASVILSVLLSVAALYVACLGYDRRSKFIATGLLMVGVVSLHFTGMAAVTVTPLSIGLYYADTATIQAMALAVATVGIIIIGTVIASYMIDNKTRERSVHDLQKMALSDGLTGLSNRAHLYELLEIAMWRAHRNRKSFALVAIDLDRFKEINDLRGHATGDETLKILSERMRRFAGEGCDVARVGGDEFMLIIPVDSDREAMHHQLSRLHYSITQPFQVDEFELSVGASIGVCIFPDDAKTQDQLINNTDLALYRAKNDRVEKICFFDQKMDEAVRHRRNLVADLRSAIANNQLELHYQVQTSVTSGHVTGYEALLRWHHPERGSISPAEFIPLAEENGLILQLGEWALRMACTQCAHLAPPLKIAVNLSPLQFLHPNLACLVREILAETGMKPECLELELTESAIISDKERTLATLEKIRKLGVTIALDDFGTGYSSLETLRAFPFDKIKLDRSFLMEVETSDQARSIIRAVLALGRSLNIPVLAEGIETRNQLDILRDEGCDTAQGFLLGRPVPLGQIEILADHPLGAIHLLRNTLWELRQAVETDETGDLTRQVAS